MRKIIISVVLFLAIVFVILRFSELKNILDTLDRSNYRFLIAAVIIELIWLLNSATDYGSIFRLVGLNEKKSHLVLVATAANFVNVIAPSVGIGGMAVFIDDAARHNHPTGRVTVVGVLYVLFDYLAFFCVLALGFIVLIRRNNLNAGELTAAAILLVIAAGVASLLYLGYKSAERLGKTLAWLARLVNRIMRPFIHRDYLQEGQAHFFASEAAEGIAMLRGKQKELLWPFLYALNNFALLICHFGIHFPGLGNAFFSRNVGGRFCNRLSLPDRFAYPLRSGCRRRRHDDCPEYSTGSVGGSRFNHPDLSFHHFLVPVGRRSGSLPYLGGKTKTISCFIMIRFPLFPLSRL